MVAKSYQKMKQICEPFESKGRMYVNVQTTSGSVKTVRWYTDSEYAKMYPNEKPAPDRVFKTQREVLGFQEGYITIFKGDTYSNLEWFQKSIARYCKWWGWYIVSTEVVPFDLPVGLTPIQLNWELVGNEDGSLKNDTEVAAAVDTLLYEPSVSEFQGEVGSRLDMTVTVVKAYSGQNYYGTYTCHTFEDGDGNRYLWTTNSKSWEVGDVRHIKGTVKEHKVIKNVKTTILTRCNLVKE